MTDYQPLLARALKGLERNTSEARRAIYDRARQALLNQLRSANPPMSDADITRERLALEDAIRKTETEAVQADPHAVRAPLSARPSMTSSPPAARPAPPPRAPGAPVEPKIFSPAVPAQRVTAPAAPAAAPNLRAPAPMTPAPGMRGPTPPPAPRVSPPSRPMPARERVAVPANGVHPARDGFPADEISPRETARPARALHGEFPEPPQARRFERQRPGLRQEAQAEISPEDFPIGDRARPPRGPVQGPGAAPGPVRRKPPKKSRTGIMVAGFVVLLVAIAGLLVFTQRGKLMALLGGSSSSQVADADKPKSPERIAPSGDAQDQEAAPPQNVDPAVAQRAVLYEENPGGGQQFQNFVGTAVWQTETVTLGAGRAPDLGLLINLEIPDRHMNVVIKMRRNVDPNFPASHTIEVQFITPNDPFGGVSDMRGMRAKGSETAQGNPLAAVVEKVKEGYFLLALPNIEEDNNLGLLRDRDWIDIPLVYANGRRAVLTFQKGTPGERAVNEVFLSWGKAPAN